MSVLVIGATGFIGSHLCEQLDKQSISCRALSRNIKKAKKLLKTHDIVQGDLARFDEIDHNKLFNNIEQVIFAAGVDERVEIKGEAEDFFFYHNVTQCLQVLKQAKAHGVKRVVVLGSIFTYLNKVHPEIGLADHHLYIASRCKQQELALALNDNNFSVSVAEIPLVLGAGESGESPIAGLIDYCRFAKPVFCTQGGINAISVSTLSEAIVKFTFLTDAPQTLPIVDENILWKTITETILKQLQKDKTRVFVIKDRFFNRLTRMGGYFQQLIGIQAGLNQRYVGDIVNQRFFIEANNSKTLLGYKGGDMDLALAQTVDARCKISISTSLSKKYDQTKYHLQSFKKRCFNF